VDSRGHVHLVLGTNPLAAARCAQSLAAGARPVLIAPDNTDDDHDGTTTGLHYGLRARVDAGEVKWLRRAFADDDLHTLGRAEVDAVVDAVFVTGRDHPAAARVAALCRRRRIPVNVVDAPALCSFTLLSTHVDGPLQVGVTTNGRGCKLAARIRREVAAALPTGLGAACARLGDARRRILDEDRPPGPAAAAAAADDDDAAALDDAADQSPAFNKLVLAGDAAAARSRRLRWLAQVCEYWPLKRLAGLTDDGVEAVLRAYAADAAAPPSSSPPLGRPSSGPDAPTNPPRGRIILAGAGPGHPDLLTRATLRALQAADLVLADKLVPQGVLDLVPRRTRVVIARKFPGNADAAQEELLAAALAAYGRGEVALRLKQGDPFVYGRGGEEAAYFRAAGVPAARVVVLPGVTSALSAPLFAGIPPTQRDVADQVLVCTGTGKKGVPPAPPGFREARTVVFLMALHRIAGLVAELTAWTAQEAGEEGGGGGGGGGEGGAGGKGSSSGGGGRARRLWPRNTPCAVVERASCPDQKVIRTTLEHVVEAIAQEGSRPPGLLVVGKACEVLYKPEKGRAWLVEDGFQGLDLDDDTPRSIAALA